MHTFNWDASLNALVFFLILSFVGTLAWALGEDSAYPLRYSTILAVFIIVAVGLPR